MSNLKKKYCFNKYQKLWLKKLRSGRLKQTRGKLRGTNDDGVIGYCCLGVAALACGVRHDNAVLNTENTLNGEKVLGGVCRKLHIGEAGEFRDIADLAGGARCSSLASLNDTYLWDFKGIADFIEENPELVFTNA